jgi:hypothetical protein
MAKGKDAVDGDRQQKIEIMAAVFFGIRLWIRAAEPIGGMVVTREQAADDSVADAQALAAALDKIQ